MNKRLQLRPLKKHFVEESPLRGEESASISSAILMADLEKSPNISPKNNDKTYGTDASKSTENGRIIYGKPTENGREKTTENLRNGYAEENLRKAKPTDTPTDKVRKMDGKPTEISSLVGLQRQTFFALAQQAARFGAPR